LAKRGKAGRPTQNTTEPAAALDPDGPPIDPSRLDRFTAQPGDIEFITVGSIETMIDAADPH
jgi:hypothetical protein